MILEEGASIPARPGNAMDPLVQLAMAMHAAPGQLAVLIGSGVSTGAGIPTAWRVITRLVGMTAAASAASSPEDPDLSDPEAWWAEHGTGPFSYSSVLESLGPSAAGRSSLLRDFVEPTEAEREAGQKLPTPAHDALADLLARGRVRVVITTNFDRLIEQALTTRGVQPQIITRPEQVASMTPLVHAPATVIKLHGDYLDLDTLNTPTELGRYDGRWDPLLEQVFGEFGLLAVGWSAEHDTALRKSIEGASTRRFPMFWDSRSARHRVATELLRARLGLRVPAADADELFTRLAASVDAIDRLAESPMDTATKIGVLKRAVNDPIRAAEVRDMVLAAADNAIDASAEISNQIDVRDVDALAERYNELTAATLPLLYLVETGITYDTVGSHDWLWADLLGRLLSAPRPETSLAEYAGAPWLPALLVLSTAGIASVNRDRDDLFLELSYDQTVEIANYVLADVPAAQAVHPGRVLHEDALNRSARFAPDEGTWLEPRSHVLREWLRSVFTAALPSDVAYRRAWNAFEYRLGLVQSLTRSQTYARQPASGEFLLDRVDPEVTPGALPPEVVVPRAAVRFVELHGVVSSPWVLRWPELALGWDSPQLTDYHETLRSYIEAHRWSGM